MNRFVAAIGLGALVVSGSASATPWKLSAGAYAHVETIRSVIDDMRPSYQREFISITSHVGWTEEEKRLRLLSLDETTVSQIRARRRASYSAHFVRGEARRQCQYGTRACDSDNCFRAPNRDYYTKAAWAKYYRGHNISWQSMRHGVNGHLYDGSLVAIRDNSTEVCSPNVSPPHHGVIRIMTRADFRYRPQYIEQMVVSDSDQIFAGLK